MKETFEDKSIVSFLDDAYGISNSFGTKQAKKPFYKMIQNDLKVL